MGKNTDRTDRGKPNNGRPETNTKPGGAHPNQTPEKRAARRAARSERRYQQATIDTQLEMQPQIDLLNSQLQQAQQDYLANLQGTRSAYGGYQNELAGFKPLDFSQEANRLTQQLGGLANQFQGGGVDTSIYGLPVGLPTSEVNAAQQLAQTMGGTALENLNSFEARNDAWQQGLANEGALASRYAKDNLQQQMNDTLQGYNNSLAGIYAQTPSMISQRVDELRQQSLENKLAQSQMKGDAAFSKWLQGYLGSQAGGNPPPPPPGETPPPDTGGDEVPPIRSGPPTGIPPGSRGEPQWSKPWMLNLLSAAKTPGVTRHGIMETARAYGPHAVQFVRDHWGEFVQRSGFEKPAPTTPVGPQGGPVVYPDNNPTGPSGLTTPIGGGQYIDARGTIWHVDANGNWVRAGQ